MKPGPVNELALKEEEALPSAKIFFVQPATYSGALANGWKKAGEMHLQKGDQHIYLVHEHKRNQRFDTADATALLVRHPAFRRDQPLGLKGHPQHIFRI